MLKFKFAYRPRIQGSGPTRSLFCLRTICYMTIKIESFNLTLIKLVGPLFPALFAAYHNIAIDLNIFRNPDLHLYILGLVLCWLNIMIISKIKLINKHHPLSTICALFFSPFCCSILCTLFPDLLSYVPENVFIDKTNS